MPAAVTSPATSPATSQPGPGPLAPGSCLVHIGPSKTGTTNIQGSLWHARRALRGQGVRYAGVTRHSALATRAAANIRGFRADDDQPPPEWHWRGLVREVRRAGDSRVVVSSEYLAHAQEPVVRQIVADLGPERTHILVTLRPIARLLPSLWQQRVQSGSVHPFGTWLEATLGREGPLPERGVWHRHRHDLLAQRWADVVGPDRVTAITVTSPDRAWLLRQVEALLALTPGTLVLHDDFVNRSLTLAETRGLLALNRRLRDAGLPRSGILYVTHTGAARYLKLRRPPPDEQRAGVPAWAVDRTLQVAHRIVDGLRASGVRIVGDLDDLLVAPDVLTDDEVDAGQVPAEVAAVMAMGVAHVGGMLRHAEHLERHERLEEGTELGYLGARDMARILAGRARRLGSRAIRTRLGLGG
jgi:hypothetical protein